MKSMRYYYCVVPMCKSTSVTTPEKTFIQVPVDQNRFSKWMDAARRDMKKSPLSPKTVSFFCEDHFNLKEDVENYMRWKIQGVKVRLKKDVVPHRFECQGKRDSKPRLHCKRIPQSSLTKHILASTGTDSELASLSRFRTSYDNDTMTLMSNDSAKEKCFFDSSLVYTPCETSVDSLPQGPIADEEGVKTNLKPAFKVGSTQSPGRRTKLKRRLRTPSVATTSLKLFKECQESPKEFTENSSLIRMQLSDIELTPISSESSIEYESLTEVSAEDITLLKDRRNKEESANLFIETKPLFGITSRCIHSFVSMGKNKFSRK